MKIEVHYVETCMTSKVVEIDPEDFQYFIGEGNTATAQDYEEYLEAQDDTYYFITGEEMVHPVVDFDIDGVVVLPDDEEEQL